MNWEQGETAELFYTFRGSDNALVDPPDVTNNVIDSEGAEIVTDGEPVNVDVGIFRYDLDTSVLIGSYLHHATGTVEDQEIVTEDEIFRVVLPSGVTGGTGVMASDVLLFSISDWLRVETPIKVYAGDDFDIAAQFVNQGEAVNLSGYTDLTFLIKTNATDDDDDALASYSVTMTSATTGLVSIPIVGADIAEPGNFRFKIIGTPPDEDTRVMAAGPLVVVAA